jgi:hypothetical protein
MNRATRGRPRLRIRAWLAGAIAVAVAGGALTAASPATAHPGAPAPVFDRNSISWRYITNRTIDNFDAACADLAAQGFMVVDLDVADQAVSPFSTAPGGYAAVFQDNTDNRRWRTRLDLTEAQFYVQHAQATNEGMRIVDFERYYPIWNQPGTARYAAVWIENVENLGTEFRTNMTSAQLSAFLSEQAAAGRMPVSIESWTAGSYLGTNMTYAAIFTRNAQGLSWQMWWGLTNAAFADKYNELRAGHRMLQVEADTRENLVQLYAGIWLENRNGRGWAEYRNMTKAQFDQRVDEQTAQGLRLITYTRYLTTYTLVEEDGETYAAFEWRYAGVWRRNTA